MVVSARCEMREPPAPHIPPPGRATRAVGAAPPSCCPCRDHQLPTTQLVMSAMTDRLTSLAPHTSMPRSMCLVSNCSVKAPQVAAATPGEMFRRSQITGGATSTAELAPCALKSCHHRLAKHSCAMPMRTGPCCRTRQLMAIFRKANGGRGRHSQQRRSRESSYKSGADGR